jgi:hypothetical protein
MGQHDPADVGCAGVSECEGVEDELAVIGPHQRIDDSDIVSAPDNEGVHLEGVGVGAHYSGRHVDVSASREELRFSGTVWQCHGVRLQRVD